MELARFPSRGGFSVRSIITFVASVLVSVLLWAILAPTPAQAATEASFVGDVITFDGHTYNPVSDLDPSHGLATGTSVYIYYSPDNVESRATSAFFIYFAPGTDPPTATTADYVAYDYNTANNTFSNPHDRQNITMEPSSQQDSYNSCTVTGGLGWIICPVTVFMADAMDNLFTLLGGFIAVQPLNINGAGSDNGLYTAWNIMRNIANIAFVVAFLIIIYSQLVGGTTNYSLKKLIPRLVVAAVLVNVSFVISALAIDISNILGWSIQDVFNNIRKDVFHISDETLGAGLNSSWSVVTALVLGGGGAAIGTAYAISSGALYLLIPMLLMLVLTVLMVFIILAARQAIIIILVIIAPLAFVANLLPNTEKWFTKWRDLFMTMLIFFPAFSLVYGGAQLAGQIIIMNAGDNIVMVLFGMAVQVAPLVITPLLLRLSGNLLGKIAQIANNPNKGLLDRNKKWANDRAELRRLNSVSKGRGPGAKMVRANEFRRRGLQQKLDTAKKQADNTWHQNSNYKTLHTEATDAELHEEAIKSHNAAHIEALKVDPTKATRKADLYTRALNAEDEKAKLEAAQNVTNTHFNRQRLGGGALNASFVANEASKTILETSENQRNIYLNQQRTTNGTALNTTVRGLEASKLTLEQSTNQYTAMVEDMKLSPTGQVGVAARNAQSSKEHLEAAQLRVQEVFDQERATDGTILNTSTTILEEVKTTSEGAKSQLAEYIATIKSAKGTRIHEEVIRTEKSKQSQQVADGRLARIIEEYKAGGKVDEHGNIFVDGKQLTQQEVALLNQMRDDNARLAAEQQGSTSAKYVQQANVSSLMDEDSTTNQTLTDSLLATAAGIDENGRARAQAGAISQLDKLENEARNNNVTLLSARAAKENKTLKDYAKDIFYKQIGEDADGNPTQQIPQDPALVEAALEALAQDGDISTLRRARMNGVHIDQGMLTNLFARNASTMKVKGGFDLQANPDLAGASRERMDTSIAMSLGDVTADQVSGQKAGWWKEVSNTLGRIVDNVETYQYDTDPAKNAEMKRAHEKSLDALYRNMTTALSDPDARRTLGDRLDETIKIHQTLHNNPHFRNNGRSIDYGRIRQGK